ncbi:MAG: hypothetical protein NTZ49_04330 [Candidatus Parcubacteria bacterium]|nr:hypothetical protein [Candidatus Parcubacteria bacterium]
MWIDKLHYKRGYAKMLKTQDRSLKGGAMRKEKVGTREIMPMIILIRGPICAGKSTVVSLLKEKIADISHIDFDAFKRGIDWTKRSTWRTRLAYKTAMFLAEELMQVRRSIIADIHSHQKYQYQGYQRLAKIHYYKLFSFLLYPPLTTILQRDQARPLLDVRYRFSPKELTIDWYKTFRLPGETLFDTSSLKPEDVVAQILQQIESEYGKCCLRLEK